MGLRLNKDEFLKKEKLIFPSFSSISRKENGFSFRRNFSHHSKLSSGLAGELPFPRSLVARSAPVL